MLPAHNVKEAMEKAVAMVGKNDYKVTVIPDGVAVIVKEIRNNGQNAVGLADQGCGKEESIFRKAED